MENPDQPYGEAIRVNNRTSPEARSAIFACFGTPTQPIGKCCVTILDGWFPESESQSGHRPKSAPSAQGSASEQDSKSPIRNPGTVSENSAAPAGQRAK